MDNIQQSVSQDKDGVITITLVNTSLDGEETIEAVLMEETPKKAEGFILHGGLNDYNEFGKEPVLYEKPLDVAADTARCEVCGTGMLSSDGACILSEAMIC